MLLSLSPEKKSESSAHSIQLANSAAVDGSGGGLSLSSIHGRIGLCDVGGFPESDGFSGKTRRKEKREEEIRVLFGVLVVKRKGRVGFQVYEAFCIFSSIHTAEEKVNTLLLHCFMNLIIYIFSVDFYF